MPEHVINVPTNGKYTRLPLTEGEKYKTTMCFSVTEGVKCRYGNACKYAHSIQELRKRKVNLKYKSQPCREYNQWNRRGELENRDYICYHGSVCSFVHVEESMEDLIDSLVGYHRDLEQLLADRINRMSVNSKASFGGSVLSLTDSGCQSVTNGFDAVHMTSTPNGLPGNCPAFSFPFWQNKLHIVIYIYRAF